jgi:putative transposase
MPRPLRVCPAGVPVHIVQRGNNRAPCFFVDHDRFVYLARLAEAARCFDCAIHAFALMTNHVHILLTPNAEHATSQLMKRLGQCYVHYVNQHHGRVGTLWQGRFHSTLIERDDQLFACHRYIELNPVAAGIVAHPRDYPWSSYRMNAEGAPSALLRRCPQYLALGPDPASRAAAYRAMFEGV